MTCKYRPSTTTHGCAVVFADGRYRLEVHVGRRRTCTLCQEYREQGVLIEQVLKRLESEEEKESQCPS